MNIKDPCSNCGYPGSIGLQVQNIVLCEDCSLKPREELKHNVYLQFMDGMNDFQNNEFTPPHLIQKLSHSNGNFSINLSKPMEVSMKLPEPKYLAAGLLVMQ